MTTYPDNTQCTGISYLKSTWTFIALGAVEVSSVKSAILYKDDTEACTQTYTLPSAPQILHLYRFYNLASTELYLYRFRLFEAAITALPNLSSAF